MNISPHGLVWSQCAFVLNYFKPTDDIESTHAQRKGLSWDVTRRSVNVRCQWKHVEYFPQKDN